VVAAALLEQRQRAYPRDRELSWERLRLIVEIDQHGLAVARLDEAVGVPVERGLELFVVDRTEDVLGHQISLKVGYGPCFRTRKVSRIANTEDTLCVLGRQRVVIGLDESELVREVAVFEEPGAGYNKPSPASTLQGLPTRYSQMAFTHGTNDGVIGTAFTII